MKKIITFFAAAICVSLIAMPLYAADIAKIATVNMQKVLTKSDSGKVAQAVMIKEGKKMRSDLEKRGAEINELKEKYDRELLVMNKDKREEKQREFRIKFNDFKILEKKNLAELKELEKVHVGRIHKEIIEVVEKIGKKEQYLLIVDRMAVLYAPNQIDLTDRVIKEINKKKKK